MKSSEIKFSINLDDNNLPEKINWKASDSGMEGDNDCKAIMLSIWDPKEENTLRIDLWTKDMMVDEMKLFFHQTLVSMANTLQRSTGDEEIVKEVREFAHNLAKKMNLIIEQK
jgi:gliding motility-associated protein GldC